ncbi:hypothetical protein, conserved [Trypanosoma brucei gambiense DAL972]|uniref:Uncharacterized protein n=1 Tax=Trypanosoma brucei gambiense (strain MHOM/CI/86/DAL972) TaxID=679716 RepID=C9ZXW6_TRYB9|nr:hypothetical protein, conserved [Trypanosoma brucei gambiense DAL972]CBH14261.1 hypothetical protein, conserved [Trypanosoma brucei gambiense DAL972]|eukprot:XP_011776531.1 hypothetical protein, conserved [Trypanosoma brucei gambiense DAL972]
MSCGKPTDNNSRLGGGCDEGAPDFSSQQVTDRHLHGYIAMALPLVHVLREQHTLRAEAIARQITEKWGGEATAVENLLKLLEEYNAETGSNVDDTSSRSTNSSREGSTDDDDSLSEDCEDAYSGDECNGSTLQTLHDVVERVRSLESYTHSLPEAVREPSTVAEAAEPPVLHGDDGEECEEECEEERRLLEDIDRAVKREMDRLSIIRKHR